MSKKIIDNAQSFFCDKDSTVFWEQRDTSELDGQQIILEHTFQRQAQKTDQAKDILLILSDQFLYKISKRQILKRIDLYVTHLEVIESLNEDHFLQLNSDYPLRGFKFTANNISLQIVTNNETVFEQWKINLKRKCLQNNFHEQYHVQKMIGKGSFAKVYLAQSNSTLQQFAIKAFSKTYMAEQFKGKQSLINEMKVMRNLNHPNTVYLHEVHETQNSIYFVIDLIQGGELLQRVKERGLLKTDELLRIAFNLLSALQHLNSKKCFHRDLKPENLLLKSKENNYEIILADFGLAAFYDQELIFKRCGTPGFVAPEILLFTDGSPIYDAKCDVFSAGVILYILLTGKQPFTGPDQKTILRANKYCEIDFGLPLFLKAPIEFQDLIQRMLRADPAERPSAADCLKHKSFHSIKSEPIDIEDQILMKSNIGNYEIEYGQGLRINSGEGQGSLQLQWRKPVYNGNVQTVESLTNCSNASFTKIELQQPKLAQVSRFSQYHQKLSKQSSMEGLNVTPDGQSPGRMKQGKQTDLHKIALKNSYHAKQQMQVPNEDINQENSDVSQMIKRFNSSEMIKVRPNSPRASNKRIDYNE